MFCCKQKTAYEMRISDWSSDVCSSDLDRIRALAVAAVWHEEHDEAERHMHLRRGETGAAGVFHRLDHVADEPADLRRGRVVDLHRPTAQHGMSHLGDLENGHVNNMGLPAGRGKRDERTEENTSELQTLMRNSYAVFCL